MRVLSVSVMLTALALLAQPGYPQVRIDTVQSRIIGPGVTYFKLLAPSLPWSIDVVKANLKNPYIKVESVKANGRLASREKTSSMSSRRNVAGHWSVAAVNADFFNADGSSTNVQVEAGELVKREHSSFPVVGFDTADVFWMVHPVSTIKLKLRDTTVTCTGVNEARADNQLVLYNRFMGVVTGTTAGGLECIVRPLTPWVVNDTVKLVVDSVNTAGYNFPIPSGKAVFSASGAMAARLGQKVRKGDTLALYQGLAGAVRGTKEALGGHPLVVQNGDTANLNMSDPFVTARHPRTGIGVSRDSSTLFLITVDGRQSSSVGMNLPEFAGLMLRLGVYQGMNFDGGGSTTMVVRNEIMNSPSDATGERVVANALVLVSTAPAGSINQLIMSPKTLRVFTGKTQQFTVNAFDQYLNPVSVTPGLFQYRLSKPSLGTISGSGMFTAGPAADTGYVIVSYQGLADSALVIVKPVGYIAVVPRYVVTDKNRISTFTAKVFDTDSIQQQVPDQSVAWRCTDTTIGTIDVLGQFKGLREGSAKIIAVYSGKADTAVVAVQIGSGWFTVDSLERQEGWLVAGENYDSVNTRLSASPSQHTLGASSLKLDYAFTYQTGMYNWVYLKNNLMVYGVPDSIFIDIISDGAPHRVFFDFTDAAGATVRAQPVRTATRTSFDTLKAYIPKGSSIYFPLRLRALAMPLGSTQVAGQQYSGTIYLDNLRVNYPAQPVAIAEAAAARSVFMLYGCYPNPFRGSSTVRYALAQPGVVQLRLYNAIGREVRSLVNEFKNPGDYRFTLDADSLASGLYLCSLTVNGTTQAVKMLLLK